VLMGATYPHLAGFQVGHQLNNAPVLAGRNKGPGVSLRSSAASTRRRWAIRVSLVTSPCILIGTPLLKNRHQLPSNSLMKTPQLTQDDGDTIRRHGQGRDFAKLAARGSLESRRKGANQDQNPRCVAAIAGCDGICPILVGDAPPLATPVACYDSGRRCASLVRGRSQPGPDAGGRTLSHRSWFGSTCHWPNRSHYADVRAQRTWPAGSRPLRGRFLVAQFLGSHHSHSLRIRPMVVYNFFRIASQFRGISSTFTALRSPLRRRATLRFHVFEKLTSHRCSPMGGEVASACEWYAPLRRIPFPPPWATWTEEARIDANINSNQTVRTGDTATSQHPRRR
jgi:hypothetical protein